MAVPSFTKTVPSNGYRWWYLDAVSDDNKHAITVIVFIGSVFSPYYARARMRGDANPDAHCAVNVALYGSPWRWCMTERTSASVQTSEHLLAIGKSAIRIKNRTLRININEVAVPMPSRVMGELTVSLPDYDLDAHPLDTLDDAQAEHFWQPIAPQCRIEVKFAKPALEWQGSAYVDSNYGNVALEDSFKSWVWSRSHHKDQSTTVLYDIVDRKGQSSQRSLHYSDNGTLTMGSAPQHHDLPKTRYWRIPRSARTPDGVSIDNLQTLEDTPFYSRSRFLEKHPAGQQVTVHESLYLDRFDSRWVRCLLPFRMPRTTRPVLLD